MSKRRAFRFQSFGVPEALTAQRQWVGWVDGIASPFALSGFSYFGLALPTWPPTWTDFRAAIDKRVDWGLDGVAYMVTRDDPFLLVTLHGAAERGRPSRAARKLVRQCHTYAEVAPSGEDVTFVFALTNGPTAPQVHRGISTPELLPDDCPLSIFDGEVICWPWGFSVPVSGMYIDFANWIRVIKLKENQ